MSELGQKQRPSQPRHVSFRRLRTLVHENIRWSSRPTLLSRPRVLWRTGSTQREAHAPGLGLGDDFSVDDCRHPASPQVIGERSSRST
jgi:hypothetical protein